MSSINSGKKITVLNGITDATIAYHEELKTAMTSLKASTEVIKVPVFDKVYNGVALAFNGLAGYTDETSQQLAAMATKYSEREGFGPVAQAAFVDCANYVKKLEGAGNKFPELELSTGLDEDVTEQTIGDFTKSLKDVISQKDPFLAKLVNVIGENMEADTEEVFTQIGAGVESIMNALVDVFEANSTDLAKFGVSLEEVNNAIKSQAAAVADAGKTTATKLQPVDTL